MVFGGLFCFSGDFFYFGPYEEVPFWDYFEDFFWVSGRQIQVLFIYLLPQGLTFKLFLGGFPTKKD